MRLNLDNFLIGHPACPVKIDYLRRSSIRKLFDGNKVNQIFAGIILIHPSRLKRLQNLILVLITQLRYYIFIDGIPGWIVLLAIETLIVLGP